jgi:hypothetical protein
MRIPGGASRHIVQTVLLDRRGDDSGIHRALRGESLQRADDDRGTVDLEEPAGGGAGVREAEAVGAQRPVVVLHPGADLVLNGVHEIAHGDHGPGSAGQLLGDVGGPRRLARVQEVVLVDGEAVTAQLRPGGHRPHVRGDAPVLAQQLLRLERPRHAHARGEQLGACALALAD